MSNYMHHERISSPYAWIFQKENRLACKDIFSESVLADHLKVDRLSLEVGLSETMPSIDIEFEFVNITVVSSDANCQRELVNKYKKFERKYFFQSWLMHRDSFKQGYLRYNE